METGLLEDLLVHYKSYIDLIFAICSGPCEATEEEKTGGECGRVRSQKEQAQNSSSDLDLCSIHR